ncbi:hypothetical protein K458DRAFT_358454 [Lentithecium fluviatile CBS 122367]|uniref:Large ribosomal subunit protein eL14 domain-containing protein n=1 Tax=Lentithecium fluviatile CBS 122367 TaxID=1168545 RepID=A0A6G1JGK7_9PLEO|nr:hypothetical protein K458DRAFT_358454 [Lentithecium fluviatile CBS 122367]
MDLTPVRIRGKKRKAPTVPAANTQSSTSSQLSKRPRTLKTSKLVRSKRKTVVAAMPTLRGLPQELLEMIFLYSMNPSLPRASPDLGRKLTSQAVTMEFVMRSFFHTVEHKVVNTRERKITSDPIIQSELLACRFFTWNFFLDYVKKAHSTLITQRGKIWEKAGVDVPGPKDFDGLWPYRFTRITYLSFAEGFHVPEKLLHGPWSEDKASLLYVLVSLGGEIDWQGTMAGETAKEGLREAIAEKNERAVAALSVLLGVTQALDTRTLRYAVIDCGCNIHIVRHLLFNAQILHETAAKGVLNFHDPKLWQWADSHEGKGVLLKDLLRKADKFALEFYLEGETDWTKIVPFPYGGSKFDTRTAFDDVVRELLVRLYGNYGRRITSSRRNRVPNPAGEHVQSEEIAAHTVEMGDAEISTSQWRYVEVGRVAIFKDGEYEGRLAAIVEIIDHKRVLVDGPSENGAVPRHAAALAHLSLTPIVLPKLPRGTGVGTVKSAWAKAEVDKNWAGSTWAKKRTQFQKRKQLNDFERFKVLKLRKQARFEVRKSLAKIKSSA